MRYFLLVIFPALVTPTGIVFVAKMLEYFDETERWNDLLRERKGDNNNKRKYTDIFNFKSWANQ